jgi:hypothetical protein
MNLLPGVLQNRQLAMSQGKDFVFGAGFEDLISRLGGTAASGSAGGVGGTGDITLDALLQEPEIQGLNQLYDLGAERIRNQVSNEMQRAGLMSSGFNIEELTDRQEDFEARRAAQIGPIAQRVMEEMQAGQVAYDAGLLGGGPRLPQPSASPELLDSLRTQGLI